MAQTSEAAGDKIFFLVSERLLHSFLSLPLPLLFYVFILSEGGEKKKPKTSA